MKKTDLHPVALEVSFLVKQIGGRLEIPTTALYEILRKQASEHSRTDERWPDCVPGVAIALARNAALIRSLGVQVKRQRRGRKPNGKRLFVWVLEPKTQPEEKPKPSPPDK